MLTPITNKKKWLYNNSWVIIITANVHFLIRDKPWAGLTLNSGCFPKVRTGWLDLGQTGHFDNETELLQRVFAEKSSSSCLTDTLL